jgi:hypothetical protein
VAKVGIGARPFVFHHQLTALALGRCCAIGGTRRFGRCGLGLQPLDALRQLPIDLS